MMIMQMMIMNRGAVSTSTRSMMMGMRYYCQSSSSSSLFAASTAISTTTSQQRFHHDSSSSTTTPMTKTTFDLPDPSSTNSSNSNSNSNNKKPLVKIVATIGPTSEQEGPMQSCVTAGINCMRLNFSHATPEEVQLRCTNLQKAIINTTTSTSSSSNASVIPSQDVVSVLLDTKGPELRTGKLFNDVSGHDTIELVAGDTITLHGSITTLPKENNGLSTVNDLYIEFPVLATVLQTNSVVLLDDGAIVLHVTHTDPTKNTVTAQIQNTASLRSRAGVNLPLADTAQHLPALSNKDRNDILYGMQYANIDYVAASFVQTAQHVIDIRQYMIDCLMKEMDTAVSNNTDPTYNPTKSLPLIISKIETASSLQHFDEILAVSDGIMVARGDLGVEIPIQQVTNAQKEMVAACNAVGKPVIVATQMLESMTKAPRPTRAEVADVTNAVYDGTDCVMLSGETAKGKYPTATITMMKEIIIASERYAANTKAIGHPILSHTFTETPQTIHSAIAKATVAASMERTTTSAIMVILQPPIEMTLASLQGMDATKCIQPYTLPGLISAFRPNVPIYTFCHTPKQARQLSLYRGIYPIIINPTTATSPNDVMTTCMEHAKALTYVQTNDEVIVVQENTNHETASMNIVKIE